MPYRIYISDEHQTRDKRVIDVIFLLIGQTLPINSSRKLAKKRFSSRLVKTANRRMAASSYSEFKAAVLALAARSGRPPGIPAEKTYILAREFIEKAVSINNDLILFH